MTNDDEGVKFETRTVKAVRGMESRTASKWEQQGWEVVSTKTGKVSSELTIRRPKPKTPWKLLAGLGGGLAVLVIFAVIMGVVTGGDDEATAEPTETTSPSATSSTEVTPSEAPSTEPTPTEAAPTVITVENNSEFAALLALTDYCAPEIATFAAAHSGETVEFDGFIGAMNSHDGASTRYDILINAGDFDPDHSAGPMFQYRDVNTTSDLSWTGTQPDTIGVGSNLHLVAEIDQYEESSCLFLLDPVETSVR